jgi:1-deoxy-D-xylulose-5-phosphate reductoisomerase
VARFLAGDVGFLDIAAIVEHTLDRLPHQAVSTLDDVMAMDGEARRVAAAAKRLSTAAE